MTITKAESMELRRLVKLRFRVLRKDLGARYLEVQAEVRRQIQEKYQDADEAHAQARRQVEQIAARANSEALALAQSLGYSLDSKWDRELIHFGHLSRKRDDRGGELKQALADATALCARAGAELDRQEADLLAELIGIQLESTEAAQFVGKLPSTTLLGLPGEPYQLNTEKGSS